MRKHAIFCCLSFLCLSMSVAQSQTLTVMLEAAKKNEANYLAALSAARANQSKAAQNRSVKWPTIGMTASTGRSRADVKQAEDATSRNTSLGVSLVQPVFRVANQATLAQSTQLEKIASEQLKEAEAALVVRVSEAYFNVLTAKDNLRVIQAQKQAVGKQLEAAKRNFEVGTATITDTREAQAQFDRIVALEIAVQTELNIQILALEQLTGLSAPVPLALSPRVVLPKLIAGTIEEWVQEAMLKSPSVLMAQANLQTAQLEFRKSQAGHLPTLDLEAGYSQNRSNGGCIASSSGNVCGNTSVGFKFTLPIFSGYATDNKIKESFELQTKAKHDLQATQLAVTQGVRQAYWGVQNGLEQVKALETAERSSYSALEATTLGYEVGVRINVDVLNAQSAWFQTQADLFKARYQVLLSSLKLKQTAGTLSFDDVVAVTQVLQP